MKLARYNKWSQLFYSIKVAAVWGGENMSNILNFIWRIVSGARKGEDYLWDLHFCIQNIIYEPSFMQR